MEEFLVQLDKYVDQIVTLLAVVVGGIITYISTSKSEKRRELRELKRQKLDTVLIPYCTCIERGIQEIKKIYDYPVSITVDDFDLWLARLNDPLDYLNAGKRVYLSPKLRDELEQYKIGIDNLNCLLDDDYRIFRYDYCKYLEKIAGNFPNAPSAMEIHITFKKITEKKIKRMILSQREVSLKDDIVEVCYVINDDWDNHRSSVFHISDDLRTTLGEIHYGLSSEDDITDPMEQLTLDFLDYFYDNTKDENKVVVGILDKTQSNKVLLELCDYLDIMRKDLIIEIDRITK